MSEKSEKPIADRYVIKKKCGEGAYGQVFLAEDLKNKDLRVAIKKIPLMSKEEGVPTSSLREISLLKELAHTNIVKLIEVLHLDKSIVLVFDYLDQDLKAIVKKNPSGLPLSTIKSYMYQLVMGMKFIHKNKILHRDIKSENILVNKEGLLKITDFGLARGYGLPISEFISDVVSLWYRAPDILLGNKNYEGSVDIWSVGCVFAEMVKGGIFFQGYSEKEQVKVIFEILGTPDVEGKEKMYKEYPGWKEDNWGNNQPKNLKELLPRLDDDGIDLLQKMLQLDPEKRIKMADALEHPYFKDVDPKTLAFYK